MNKIKYSFEYSIDKLKHMHRKHPNKRINITFKGPMGNEEMYRHLKDLEHAVELGHKHFQVYVNSPGGRVGHLDNILKKINELKKQHKDLNIKTHMGKVASAGVHLAYNIGNRNKPTISSDGEILIHPQRLQNEKTGLIHLGGSSSFKQVYNGTKENLYGDKQLNLKEKFKLPFKAFKNYLDIKDKKFYKKFGKGMDVFDDIEKNRYTDTNRKMDKIIYNNKDKKHPIRMSIFSLKKGTGKDIIFNPGKAKESNLVSDILINKTKNNPNQYDRKSKKYFIHNLIDYYNDKYSTNLNNGQKLRLMSKLLKYNTMEIGRRVDDFINEYKKVKYLERPLFNNKFINQNNSSIRFKKLLKTLDKN